MNSRLAYPFTLARATLVAQRVRWGRPLPFLLRPVHAAAVYCAFALVGLVVAAVLFPLFILGLPLVLLISAIRRISPMRPIGPIDPPAEP